MFDGIVKILCNVKHVHGHERNLISLDRPYSMNYGYYTKGGVIIQQTNALEQVDWWDS